MVGEADGATSARRFGRYEVGATIAAPRSTDGSTIFIAIARPPKPERDTSGKLALNFSPSKPNEATKAVQRPVVIKQIASSLTGNQAKLDAFLEAARTATTLRHRNVAEVDAVATEGADVYLVMDYLFGETAASLLRRLQGGGERLRTPLAAYIGEQVAAALDAGHAAGLVHAHLTPHDIFLGYDGSVHVLDIGIAEARSKLANGRISGVELEYASPEVCRRETIDPRTDVFSVGVILWELISGLSLFERAADSDVVRAICDDGIVPPKNIVPGVPKELSAITLQALIRDRGERFQTAKALGAALSDVVKNHIVGRPEDHLAKLMKQVFPEREQAKRELLKRVTAGTAADGLDFAAIERSTAPARALPAAPPPPLTRAPPAPPPDEEMPTNVLSLATAMTPPKSHAPPAAELDQPSVIIAPVVKPPPPAGTLIPSTPPKPAKPPPVEEVSAVLEVSLGNAQAVPVELEGPCGTDDAHPALVVPTTRGPGRFVALGGALLAAAILLLVIFGRSGEAKPVRPPAVSSASVAARESPPPAPAPIPEPVVTAAVPASASPVAPGETEARLHIDTVPAQAGIFIAGEKKGVSPLDVTLPKGADPVVVEIRHAGYVTLKERVVPDMNQRLKLTMTAAAGPARSAAPAPTPAPYHKFE